MNPTASRSAVPLMAGPVCSATLVPSGRPLTVTGSSPDLAAPASPVALTAKV
jgi:hypothetical protein